MTFDTTVIYIEVSQGCTIERFSDLAPSSGTSPSFLCRDEGDTVSLSTCPNTYQVRVRGVETDVEIVTPDM